MAKSTLIPETAGYDYFENSGFLLHGEGDVKLDAKSYIQSILNRTEGAKNRINFN